MLALILAFDIQRHRCLAF